MTNLKFFRMVLVAVAGLFAIDGSLPDVHASVSGREYVLTYLSVPDGALRILGADFREDGSLSLLSQFGDETLGTWTEIPLLNQVAVVMFEASYEPTGSVSFIGLELPENSEGVSLRGFSVIKIAQFLRGDLYFVSGMDAD